MLNFTSIRCKKNLLSHFCAFQWFDFSNAQVSDSRFAWFNEQTNISAFRGVGNIANGPNPENAKKLIDYILSKEIEEKLAFSRSAQIPVRKGVKKPDNVRSLSEIKAMEVDFEAVADQMETTGAYLQDLFLRW